MLSDTFCLVSYVILYHLDACCLMSSHVISFHLVPQCFFNICQCFPKSSDRWCQLISHCFLNVSSCLSLSHVVMSSLISLVWFVSCFLLHQLFFFSITSCTYKSTSSVTCHERNHCQPSHTYIVQSDRNCFWCFYKIIIYLVFIYFFFSHGDFQSDLKNFQHLIKILQNLSHIT